jgi:GTPase KRas protein
MREHFMRSGQGFVFFYSVASRADFDQIRSLHEQILAVKRVDSVPAVIVGYDGFKTSERKVTTEEGEGLAKELGCLFVEMDRLQKNEGVFHNLIRELWRHEDELEPSTEKLAEPREKAKKSMRQRLSRLWKR